MASTNTNTTVETTTTSEKVLSTDIYQISEFIDDIRSNNIDDLNETSSIVGIFGYMNEIFSQSLQNTLIVVSETSNETIATRAKFTKNVITHAMNYGITKITATPAVMTMMIYLPINYLEANFESHDTVTGKATFRWDKDIPIYVDKFEYHTDYDILINRINLYNNIDEEDEETVTKPKVKYQYSAMYDLFDTGTTNIKQNNPISDITNPYITTVTTCTIDRIDYVAFSIRLHQVSNVYHEETILTDNSIENKTITFEFDDQLAAFDIDVTEKDKVYHITPIYSGLTDITNDTGLWCNYEYLDSNTIMIKFNRDSFVPSVNSSVKVNIKLTEGANGNFYYNNNFKTSLESEKYNGYNGMYALVYPLLEGRSYGGINKKSIKDLRKIIPREASSRGAVINTTDLNNYFNSINNDQVKLYFTKVRDNPFERLYYAHLIMRKDAYVYPTNTCNLYITQDDFNGAEEGNNLSINPGTKFYYYDHGSNSDNDYATVVNPVTEVVYDENNQANPKYQISDKGDYYTIINEDGDEKRIFEYISPFLITIDKDLIASYLMTIMNVNKTFKFDSINMDSELQFIATNMNWNRKMFYYTYDENGNRVEDVPNRYDNKYTMTISMTQNNQMDYGLVKYHIDANGNTIFDRVKVKVYMVMYTDETATTPYRYAEAKLTSFDETGFIYDFTFTLETDDLMDLNNRINIIGCYNAKPEEYQHTDNVAHSHGYMNKNTYCKIFILADFGYSAGDTLDNGTVLQPDDPLVVNPILYPPTVDESGNLSPDPGYRKGTGLESILPTRDDIVEAFLDNKIYLRTSTESLNVCSIIKTHRNADGINDWMQVIKEENNDESESDQSILNFIRRNKSNKSSILWTEIVVDEKSIKVIDSYHYEDLSRYTVCNTFTVDGGLDFYYDYSNIMGSVVNIAQVSKTTNTGEQLYKEIVRTDKCGNNYTEYVPLYKMNANGGYYYDYTIKRIPMVKDGFLNTEGKFQDFIYELDERRKYMNECLSVLEDTFGVDLKFFNTFGPSRRFYHVEPNSTSYKATTAIAEVKVYSNTVDEDIEDNVITTLGFGVQVYIEKVNGQWGYIMVPNMIDEESKKPVYGWIKLSNVSRNTDYIDNVALEMKFQMETATSSDKYIKNNIVYDIKEYIEDINSINELHIPNIITLITNSYREQLIYFEFLGLNNYGVSCQHLYLDETPYTEITPEFLNIAMSEDGAEVPLIDITAY